MSGCTHFSSAIGHCAIAWRGETIVGLGLPMEDGSSPVERLLHRHRGLARLAAPPAIEQIIARIVAHLDGALDDLRDIPVQQAAGTFDRTIYALTRDIPPGETRSYGELATAAGVAGLAREVGQAMGRNPTPLLVPCHRVLPADGSIGGFSAPGGAATKRRLLGIERAPAVAQLPMFD